MNKLDSTLSGILARAFAVIGKVSEMDTVLGRIHVSRITNGTENGLQVSREYTAQIRGMMGELIHELHMLQSYLKKENEDPNGTATEEKKDEEKVPKMAETVLKAIESINNVTD